MMNPLNNSQRKIIPEKQVGCDGSNEKIGCTH